MASLFKKGRKEERKKESSLPQFISLSCSFLSSLSFPLFSCCVQKGNSILLFNFALYNNFTTETSKHRVLTEDIDEGLTTTIVSKKQELINDYVTNLRNEELILDNPHDSILYRILLSEGLHHAQSQWMIHRVVRLARSMTMSNVKPIYIVIVGINDIHCHLLLEKSKGKESNVWLAKRWFPEC